MAMDDATVLEIIAPSRDVAQDIRDRYMEDVWEFERMNGQGEWHIVGDTYDHPRVILGEYPSVHVAELESGQMTLSRRQRLAIVGVGIIGGGLLLSKLD